MAKFTIRGRGPQFPNGYSQTAEGVAGALNVLEAVRELCGSAVAVDANGHEISVAELRALEKNESGKH